MLFNVHRTEFFQSSCYWFYSTFIIVKEPILHDLNSSNLLKICITTQDLVYLGEGSMYTWECAFCCFEWVVLLMSIKVVYSFSVSYAMPLLVFWLLVLSILREECRSLQLLLWICLFLILLLLIFTWCIFKLFYLVYSHLGLYLFLMNWPFYHSELFIFIPDNFLCSEVCFVWYYSSFLLISESDFPSFTFSLPMSLYLKRSFLKTIYNWVIKKNLFWQPIF